MTMRVLIVDDEELARGGIRALLNREADIEIVAECRNGREAIEAINSSVPDIVFLDIQMPGKTGLDVIDAVDSSKCPYIIFVTAFDKYAVQAFDRRARDYLLKPIDEDRFYLALARARAALAGSPDNAMVRRVLQAAVELRWSADNPLLARAPDRLAVKVQGKVIIVRVADIDWIEAANDYVSLHVGRKKWLMRETLTTVETRLARSGFVRMHRSTLVNVNRVQELRPLLKGNVAVILMDGTELKLSRKYRSVLGRLGGADL
jgi:two-component system, LytTR family, response regulator